MCHTIAIIDDDEAILDAARLVLEGESWVARLYAKGHQFVADLRSLIPPDCLVLDPHLPDMSGLEVASYVARTQLPIPIIVWTAQPHSSKTTEILQANIHIILTKPVAAEPLIEEIRVAIGNNRRTPS